MSDILYGCKLMVVYKMNKSTGTKDGAGIKFETPQQASINPQFSEGGRQELYGGRGLLATIEDDDELLSVQLQFTNAELPGAALERLAGGKFLSDEYTAPMVGDEIPPVIIELYVARYSEGSQNVSAVQGYRKWTFNNVQGRIPSYTAQERNFLVPQFTVECTENALSDKRVYEWEDVSGLPA